VETLIDYFARVGQYDWWVVAIELVLIGLVVYWAVDFLEGTGGERLFRGVVFILIAGVLILNRISERYGFERLEYLYKGFALAVLIIAVSAFQPEIRRALIRIGQPKFLGGGVQHPGRIAEEIISAVTDLSAAKVGAIIVLENRVALGEFVETGVKVEAVVTAELLKTLFYPGTPLHDMAIVIRGDRVVAANVQLPLAEAGTVDGVELGSRHRAAIGISVVSDATCIVISEETGIISVAENGKLKRKVSDSDLRMRLISTVEQTSNRSLAAAIGKLRKPKS
jgi:diadenylate cyclase